MKTFKSFYEYLAHYYPEKLKEMLNDAAFEKGAEEYGKYLANKVFSMQNPYPNDAYVSFDHAKEIIINALSNNENSQESEAS